MIIEISIAIIACAFVALVIYLILVLRQTCQTLNQLNHTMETVNKQVESFDSLFKAVSLVGDKALESAQGLSQGDPSGECTADANRTPCRSQGTMSDIVEWLTVGLGLWLQMKKRRR